MLKQIVKNNTIRIDELKEGMSAAIVGKDGMESGIIIKDFTDGEMGIDISNKPIIWINAYALKDNVFYVED